MVIPFRLDQEFIGRNLFDISASHGARICDAPLSNSGTRAQGIALLAPCTPLNAAPCRDCNCSSANEGIEDRGGQVDKSERRRSRGRGMHSARSAAPNAFVN